MLISILLIACIVSTSFVASRLSTSEEYKVHGAHQTIYVEPLHSLVTPCTNFTVNVNIRDVNDLYAWQFNMTFNPAIMQCVSVTEGPFLKSVRPTGFAGPGINNMAGTIKAACTLLQPGPGANGNGTLATITFHCTGRGGSVLDLHDTKLLNSTAVWVPTPPYWGDANGDLRVDIFDLLIVASQYCRPPPPITDPRADINGDGHVDIEDLIIVALNFGRIYPGPALLPQNNVIAHAVEDGYVTQSYDLGVETFPPGTYKATIMKEDSANKHVNSFGWYMPTTTTTPLGRWTWEPSFTYTEIFSGPENVGATKQFTATQNFGFYLFSDDLLLPAPVTGGIFYTENAIQPDAFDHAIVEYVNQANPSEGYLIRFEDAWQGAGGYPTLIDYNDMWIKLVPTFYRYKVKFEYRTETEVIEPFAQNRYIPGIVSYWKFDETFGAIAADSADLNLGALSLPSSPTWIPTGKVNGALDFNGIDNWVEVPNSANLRINDEITIEAWINPDTIALSTGVYYTILSKHYADGYSLRIRGDPTGYGSIMFKGGWMLQSAPLIAPNNWYHVAATYDGTVQKIYVNGVIVESQCCPPPHPIGVTDKNLVIGAQTVSHDLLFDGKIDEVAIFNRALTRTEIQQHYQNSLRGLQYWEGIPLDTLITTHINVYNPNHGLGVNVTKYYVQVLREENPPPFELGGHTLKNYTYTLPPNKGFEIDYDDVCLWPVDPNQPPVPPYPVDLKGFVVLESPSQIVVDNKTVPLLPLEVVAVYNKKTVDIINKITFHLDFTPPPIDTLIGKLKFWEPYELSVRIPWEPANLTLEEVVKKELGLLPPPPPEPEDIDIEIVDTTTYFDFLECVTKERIVFTLRPTNLLVQKYLNETWPPAERPPGFMWPHWFNQCTTLEKVVKIPELDLIMVPEEIVRDEIIIELLQLGIPSNVVKTIISTIQIRIIEVDVAEGVGASIDVEYIRPEIIDC